jgi:hypothetical protein
MGVPDVASGRPTFERSLDSTPAVSLPAVPASRKASKYCIMDTGSH